MLVHKKLFLYSLSISAGQAAELTDLVGKDPKDITFALIENAADVEEGSENWLGGFRNMLQSNGYQLEQLDLRNWLNRQKALREKLSDKDVIWIGGGNTFYLRWILRETGADKIIAELISQGKVYAGWSAGAIVAGPTLQYIDAMENLTDVPEIIWEGLNLTNIVVVPHLDSSDFSEVAKKVNLRLENTGYDVVPLDDNQVLIINGNEQKII
ncbi:MAG TPA: Type 1 glutamine amidotransferase-like domain-containing protein [Cytophagales bacterium]|nr:Type 1 glutamine amidotransferase-like domain-containing protein [Cytophagales bacterium]